MTLRRLLASARLSRRSLPALALTALVVTLLVVMLQSVGQVRWADVAAGIRRIGLYGLGTAALVVWIQYGLLETRLWVLFPRPGAPGLPRAAHAFSVGEFVNGFLPVRAGDVTKVMLIAGRGDRDGPGMSKTAGVLVAEKIIELVGLTFALCLVGLGHLVPSRFGPLSRLQFGLLIALVAAAAIVAGLRSMRIRTVFAGLGGLFHPVRLPLAFALTLASWTLEVASLHILAARLGHDLHFSDGIRVIVLFNLGMAVPLSAANLGTFEATIGIGMTLAGMSLADGLGVGTAYHLVQLVAISTWVALSVGARYLRPGWFGHEALDSAESRPGPVSPGMT